MGAYLFKIFQFFITIAAVRKHPFGLISLFKDG